MKNEFELPRFEWEAEVVVATIFGMIFGIDALVVLGVLALVFGGSQIPKLARSLGSAKHNFEAGLAEGACKEPDIQIGSGS